MDDSSARDIIYDDDCLLIDHVDGEERGSHGVLVLRVLQQWRRLDRAMEVLLLAAGGLWVRGRERRSFGPNLNASAPAKIMHAGDVTLPGGVAMLPPLCQSSG
jgi:hypothetical protein